MYRLASQYMFPLVAGMLMLLFAVAAQPAMSQTPIPVEGPGKPVTVVAVDDVDVSLRTTPDKLPAGCSPEETVALLRAFIDAFNRGDQQALKSFFPAEAYQPSTEGTFSLYGVSGFMARDRDGLMHYIAERHTHGEHMRLLQIDYGPNVSWEGGDRGIGFTLDVLRSADDIPTHEAGVKGDIDCQEQTIYHWSQGDRGIVPDSWFEQLQATPAR